MSDIETRVGEVERDLARISERSSALGRQLEALLPLPVKVADLAGLIAAGSTAFAALAKDFTNLKEDLTSVNKMHVEERRSLKVALIGLVAVIVAAIIGGVFVLLAAHR